jgi:hypothetical protein
MDRGFTLQSKLSVPSIFCYAFLHNNHCTLTWKHQLYFVLQQVLFLCCFLSLFLHPVPYFTPKFLNDSIFTKAAYSQTSKWLVVGFRTAHTAVVLYFHAKHLKEGCHKTVGCAGH